MRGVALLVLTLIASCAPDYGHSAFRCDTGHDCPGSQSCLSGRCRRGGPTGDSGVGCGSATCDTTQQCCVDSDNPPICLGAGEVCLGASALCDSKDDCRTGDYCCADGDIAFCDASCQHYACRVRGDCPSTAPNCCDADATTAGVCARSEC